MMRITDFRLDGKGFMARVITDSDNALYRTNRAGEGLWRNESQVMGTEQFSVYGIKPASMRAKLRRFLEA